MNMYISFFSFALYMYKYTYIHVYIYIYMSIYLLGRGIWGASDFRTSFWGDRTLCFCSRSLTGSNIRLYHFACPIWPIWWKWSFFMGLSLRGVENRIRGRKMIHFGGGHVSGHLKYDFFIFRVHFGCHYQRIFVHTPSLSAYICPYAVTIGVYLSICYHYWRIFVYKLSLLAYIICVYNMRL